MPAPDQCAVSSQQLIARHETRRGPGPVRDCLRQIVERGGQPVALLVWGPAAYALEDRDRWIFRSASRRRGRLELVVQNRRFCGSPRGRGPKLADHWLPAALALEGKRTPRPPRPAHRRPTTRTVPPESWLSGTRRKQPALRTSGRCDLWGNKLPAIDGKLVPADPVQSRRGSTWSIVAEDMRADRDEAESTARVGLDVSCCHGNGPSC